MLFFLNLLVDIEDAYKFLLASQPLMNLRLCDGGLLVCAPPCSLFGAASSSVHKRSVANPAGDQTRFKVRLAQRIWKSFVSRLRRKHVWICLDFSGFEALIRFHVF